MKGVILAGGKGTRLRPLTLVTNKHLLAIYDRPMIEYPLSTLLDAGIRDVLLISGREHAGHFLEYLGSGARYNAHFSYRVQDEAGGIAHALLLAEDFADGEPVTVILGDNIFEDTIADSVKSFTSGGRIFLKKVSDPQRFGVPTLRGNIVTKITEKPRRPASEFAVTGLYQYDARVFDIIRSLKPSARGELEITDVNNAYITAGTMQATTVHGFWSDAGTFESLARTVRWAEKQKSRSA